MIDKTTSQYATAAESAAVMKPDTRSVSEKQLDTALDAAWANEQGVTVEHHLAITHRIAVAMLDQQALRIAELEAQLESIGAGGVSGQLISRADKAAPGECLHQIAAHAAKGRAA